MNQEQQREIAKTLWAECYTLLNKGQDEYSHREEAAHANFERIAERTGLTREQVLLTHLEKHLDGIHSYVKGHRSQRESVKGRINDAIVYLVLLRGMVEESESIIAEVTLPPYTAVG